MGAKFSARRTFTMDPDAPLSDRDAWAIATAWHPEIARSLWLSGELADAERSPSRPESARSPLGHRFGGLSIVKAIEYIDFSFTGFENEALARRVRAARAATIAWFALSCCPGFSGTENPAFWRRVFTPPQYDQREFPYVPPVDDDWSRLHVVESHAFFPHPDRPFPRVRLRGPEREILALFFQRESSHGVDETLASALRSLAPFICDPRWERALPVTMYTARVDAVRAFLHTQAPPSNISGVPEFGLTEVHCVNDWDVNRHTLDLLLKTTNVKAYFSDSLEAHSAVASVLEKRRCAHVETLDLSVTVVHGHRVNPSYFGACCSALPHIGAVRGVKMVKFYRTPATSPTSAAWLGYAIFHPDADRSFTDLTFEISGSDELAVQSLASMAVGNNLLRAMGVSTTQSSVYAQARIRPGTSVRSTPRLNTPEGKILFTFTSDSWITICPTKDSENDSVRAVLPGHGLGWISNDDIIETVERPPGPSCVRRLSLTAIQLSGEDWMDFVFTVLSILGRRLEYLHFVTAVTRGHGRVPAATLCRILELCPNLKSLRVSHDGSCWSSDYAALLPDQPRLEELYLESNAPLPSVVAPQLGNLKWFYYSTLTSSIQTNSDALLALLELCPELECMVWRRDLARLLNVDHQAVTAFLAGVITRGVHDQTRVPLAMDARLAFLSVVRACDPSKSALGLLGPEITRVVLSFSSSYVPRKFCITVID